MPRWLWFAPLAVLTMLVGLWGFRLGWIAATLTETDVIERYAQRYLDDRAREGAGPDARRSDCLGYAGEAPGVWLVVRCSPQAANGRSYEYAVNRFGGLEDGGWPWVRRFISPSRGLQPET